MGSELLGADLDLALLDRGGGEDAIVREAFDRQRLAGHRLLIHHRLAADDRAVDRDSLTRRDDHDVSRVERADVDRLAMVAGPPRHDPLGHADDVAERRPRFHDAARHDELADGSHPRQERGGREVSPRDQEPERRSLEHVSVQPPASGERGARSEKRRCGRRQQEAGGDYLRHRQAARGDEHRGRADHLQHRRRREGLTLSPRGVRQGRLRGRDQLRHHAVEPVDDRVGGEAVGIVVDSQAAGQRPTLHRPNAWQRLQLGLDRRVARLQPMRRVADAETPADRMRDRAVHEPAIAREAERCSRGRRRGRTRAPTSTRAM